MCGICGFLTDKEIKHDTLVKMTDTMQHRGPDDSGVYLAKAGEMWLGFGHRRLSIIDISNGGHQPMFSNDKSVCITFNGEIYNFLEIRNELKDAYSFSSNSDTEVILAAYLSWDIDFIHKLNGMFSFGLYDFKKQRLILARDRIGEKPLYYYKNDKKLIFSSELKAIMACDGFVKEIDKTVISSYLYCGYISAPDTVFQNTFKLEAGTYLIYENYKIKKTKYWDIASKFSQLSTCLVEDYDEAKQGMLELLEQSIKYRMIADVPLGAFLSGGIDSSIIVSLAQKNSRQPLKTYSIGFSDERFNEAEFAKQISDYLGTNHTEYYIDSNHLISLLEDLPKYYDEPMADASEIPTMLVSQLAKKDVSVVLSGDGGDEFFCGYDVYDQVLQLQKFDDIGEFLFKLINLPGIEKLNLIKFAPEKVARIIGNRERATKTQCFSLFRMKTINDMLKYDRKHIKLGIEDKFETPNWQERRMLFDMLTYLPEDILCKVDRATMKYSLEARCPFLDYKVMEYSFRIPHRFKYKNGEKKYILKNIAYDLIPKNLLDRPKKGFGVPIADWMRQKLRPDIEQFSSCKFIEKQDIFNFATINKIIDGFFNRNENQNQNLIWYFYIFQKWYSFYMK